MTLVRKTKLEELGFKSCHRETWDGRFAQLLAYKRANGHCNVPRTEPNLGRWVTTCNQREKYRFRENKDWGSRKLGQKLTQEQIAKLENVGFQWDGRINCQYARGSGRNHKKRKIDDRDTDLQLALGRSPKQHRRIDKDRGLGEIICLSD